MTDRNKLSGWFLDVADKYPTALANVECHARCGPGWMSAVVPVLELCEREGVAVDQIKEKFGGLRIYTSHCNEAVDAAIKEAEALCRRTCEECGAPGTLRKGGWLKTLCNKCQDTRNQRRAEVGAVTATQDGCATSTQEDRLTAAGKAAIAEATRLWSLDVYDPRRTDHTPAGEHSRKAIQDIVHRGGWTWIDYRGDGDVEWCGLFAAACWRTAGIDPKWLATFWASTYRLDAWATYRDFNNHKNPKPAQGPHRFMAKLDSSSKSLPFEPRAGDILTVGDGIPAFGDHITLIESWDDAKGIFTTLSGNGGGVGPDGKRRQGIVRADFKLGGSGYCARRLIRPAPGDLVP